MDGDEINIDEIGSRLIYPMSKLYMRPNNENKKQDIKSPDNDESHGGQPSDANDEFESTDEEQGGDDINERGVRNECSCHRA